MSLAQGGRGGKGPTDAYIATDGEAPKRAVPVEWLVVLLVVLSASGSFGLGYLMGKEAGEGGDRGLRFEGAAIKETAGAVAGAATATESRAVSTPTPEPVPFYPVPEGAMYVASVSGETYHLPWCGSAKNIKEENRIWFSSKAEAEAAGYRPAKNCKGI